MRRQPGGRASGPPVRSDTLAPRGRRLRVGALALGSTAVLVMGIVGCTRIMDGSATANSGVISSYRVTVSKSISASLVTSSSLFSVTQASLTTQAIKTACTTFATTSEAAVSAVNTWVDDYNNGRNTSASSSAAVTALNQTADEVSAAITDAMSTEMRDAFTSYAAAARSVAEAISTNAGPSTYNSRKEQLNTLKTQGLDLCRSF